jgi:hypothetical protein
LGQKSLKENRNLTKYKTLIRENGRLNYEYGKNFERWFNDRFNARKEVLSIHAFLIFYINSRHNIINGLLNGQDGWLFYRGINRMQTIEHYQNVKLFSQERLEKTAAYLQSINDWCEKNNKKFYFFIAPDKHRIYGEQFPFYVKKVFPDEQDKTYQLIDYLRKHTTVKVIYPDKILKEHKKEGRLYWKTDTHWNEMGAYWGYRALMEEISKDFDVKPFIFTRYKTSHNPNELTDEYRAPDFAKRYRENAYTYRTINPVFLYNKTAKYKLVLFRDSFADLILPYLGNTFQKVSEFWCFDDNWSSINNYLQYTKGNADIVVVEIAERFTEGLYRYILEEGK